MVGIDYVLIAIVLLSALISVFRGFVREFISLISWSAAVFITINYTGALSSLIPDSLASGPTGKTALAGSILFVLTVVAGYVVHIFAQMVIKKAKLTLSDRLLGAVFGFSRGIVFAVIVVSLCGFTPLTKEDWWSQSEVVKTLTPLAQSALKRMPESLRSRNDLVPAIKSITGS